jgi:hypothetical protein
LDLDLDLLLGPVLRARAQPRRRDRGLLHRQRRRATICRRLQRNSPNRLGLSAISAVMGRHRQPRRRLQHGHSRRRRSRK